MITITCQRMVGDEADIQQCGETAEIGSEDGSGWHPIGSRTEPTVEVVLPDGWAADRVGHDFVIHCPVHAS